MACRVLGFSKQPFYARKAAPVTERDWRIWSVFAKKRRLTRKAGPPVHDDHVRRDFTATAPNRLWLTDITEHRTDEGKPHLCVIKDVLSNRIVGYSIDARMKASLAVSALHNARALREPAGTVVHSDRGSQFRSSAFVRTLKCSGLEGSMGRVGACVDNAAMESFFLTSAEERSGPPAMVHGGGSPGHRDLDREEIPQETPSAAPRAANSRRV